MSVSTAGRTAVTDAFADLLDKLALLGVVKAGTVVNVALDAFVHRLHVSILGTQRHVTQQRLAAKRLWGRNTQGRAMRGKRRAEER